MQDLLPWMAPWSLWSLYAFLFVVHIWHGWHGHRFHSTPRCPRCGYDRTGLPSDTCPECGHALRNPGEAFRSRRRRYWLIAMGLIVATALPAVAVQRRVRQYGWEYYRRVGPVYWMFPTDTEWSYDIAGYRIDSISDVRENWNGAQFSGEILRVRRGGLVHFRDDYNVLAEIVTDPPPGTDLNGNGIPDVIVGTCAGGHSLMEYTILELWPEELLVIGTLSTTQGMDVRAIRDGRDGTWKIVMSERDFVTGKVKSDYLYAVAWNGARFDTERRFNSD